MIRDIYLNTWWQTYLFLSRQGIFQYTYCIHLYDTIYPNTYSSVLKHQFTSSQTLVLSISSLIVIPTHRTTSQHNGRGLIFCLMGKSNQIANSNNFFCIHSISTKCPIDHHKFYAFDGHNKEYTGHLLYSFNYVP